MRGSDVGALAIESLTIHRLRAGLTLLAVAIGAVAVLVLTSLGDAAKGYVVSRFAGMGTNLVTVSPGKIETSGLGAMGAGSDRDLTLEDCEAVRLRAPAVRLAVPISLGSASVSFAGRHRDVYVVGTTADYVTLRDLVLERGRFLPAGDPRSGAAIAVLGTKLAHELFPDENPVGRMVRIAEARFRVVGVLASKGQSLGIDFDDLAIVPVARGLRLFNQSNLHHILIQAVDASSVEDAVAEARAVLTDRHRQEDFTMVTQDAMLKSFQAIMTALTAALAGIAAISLGVAGIGIMNVMLVAVPERVSEVGLLKALGARRSEITWLFLAEAVLLSGLGAVLGIAIGAGVVRLMARLWPDVPMAPSAAWIGAIMALALVTGVTFGLLPARRAAALPAVAALQGKR
jgi:putative ABC transport system permease protein